ncbi:putative hydrolase [Actinacidiphila reveromycinica]|uniref:Putative hydrolase n=1 Tax=Actinacidiphila reveromycinica TaxID=659352 RepID=A0A7U3UN12_9ACTN|nr:FAD-binding protein [Streptomyces sp. SN-593]BBA97260.1 putative hydrolase [Streptomyces sp. SN-593]
MPDTHFAADPAQTPVGVWTGSVRHDDQTDPYTISFAPDGTIALRTPVTVGTGTWVAGPPGRFSYELTEVFTPASGHAGHLEAHVEGRLDGSAHSGTGTARIYTPDGVLVHTTTAESAGERVGDRPAAWHALVGLGAPIRGRTLHRGDDGFDEAVSRRPGNGGRPEAVVVAADADDVAAAVRFAAEARRAVAVEPGGPAPADGAVLVVTADLTELAVDQRAATARIGAGLRWGEVLAAAAEHGLAPLRDLPADAGAADYLTGDASWARGAAAPASHDVRSLELVTADGLVRTTSPTREPDLFWAVRGGASGLGVLTGAEIGLAPALPADGGEPAGARPAAPHPHPHPNARRLAELKAAYDPHDLFRTHHSTPPSPTAGERGTTGMPLSTDPQSAMAELVKLAGAQAARADAERKVSPEVIRAVVDAGFARWRVPARWGGAERSHAELTAAVARLGEECSSTAWLASVAAYSARYVACMPEQGQADIWADGPDVLAAIVFKPLGTVVPVDGGFRLSGSWTYVSGVDHFDWALLTGPGPGPSAAGQPMRLFAVPRRDYAYEDTWSSLGMRATGSHTLVLDDVFVPEHRTCLREDAMRGALVGLPGYTQLSNPAVSGLMFVSPVLGAARAALAVAAQSVAVAPTGPRTHAGQPYQVDFARAAGEIDAAQLLLERAAAVADGDAVPPELARRNRRDCALALQMLIGAVDRLLRIGGTRAQDDGHPLQRYWRDVRSVSSHAVMQFEPAGLAFTEGLVGQP